MKKRYYNLINFTFIAAAVIAVTTGCSSVFTASINGTAYDKRDYEEGNLKPVSNVEIYVYENEEDRDTDLSAWQDSSVTNYFSSAVSDNNGEFSMDYIWQELFPVYGDTADVCEVFFVVYDPKGNYPLTAASATVLSDNATDIRILLDPDRVQATVTGRVTDALTAEGISDVTVSGYLPLNWTVSGTSVTVTEWGGERVFKTTTDDNGKYTAAFTFSKTASDDADEGTKLRLLFSHTEYSVSADGDSDLSTGADVDSDGADDTYYQSPAIWENEERALDTISLKPVKFSETLEGTVYFDVNTDGSVDSGDSLINGKALLLTITDPEFGAVTVYRTYSYRNTSSSEAEDGYFRFPNVTWADNSYTGPQSSASAVLTVEGETTVLPSAAVTITAGGNNYAEVLYQHQP